MRVCRLNMHRRATITLWVSIMTASSCKTLHSCGSATLPCVHIESVGLDGSIIAPRNCSRISCAMRRAF